MVGGGFKKQLRVPSSPEGHGAWELLPSCPPTVLVSDPGRDPPEDVDEVEEDTGAPGSGTSYQGMG